MATPSNVKKEQVGPATVILFFCFFFFFLQKDIILFKIVNNK